MTLDEMIEVMQACKRGEEIEISNNLGNKWVQEPCPNWNWVNCTYRIKPKPKQEVTQMTTKEAIQAMLDGKKVKAVHKSVKDFEYFYFHDNVFINNTEELMDVNYWCNAFANWEIYEEPKPKQAVTIEKWLVMDGNILFILEGNKEYFEHKVGGHISQVKLIDTYEVKL